MKRVCVFCGSNFGVGDACRKAAADLGRALCSRGLGLVYGGAGVGLMGVLADAVLDLGGEAIGVIPQALVDRELAHRGLTRLEVVGSMHERKALMAELSDAFIAMPGGLGTLDELFEILTWAQLGIHAKPCGLLDVEGYFDLLAGFLDHAVAQGFILDRHRDMVLRSPHPDELLDRMAAYEAPRPGKWTDRELDPDRRTEAFAKDGTHR